MKLLKKIVKHEDGQVLVIVALLMVVLVGFAALIVDVGAMYLTKTNMQNACDAAALAGAQALPNADTAKSTAKNYAELNGTEQVNTNVETPYNGDKTKIEVVCTRTVPFSFAKVLGFIQSDVTARAVAQKVANLPEEFTKYAIFSESTEKALDVGKSGQSKVIGIIHTNNTLNLGKHLNVSGIEYCKGITQDGSNTIGDIKYPSCNITIPDTFKTALLAQVKLASHKYTGNQTSDTLDLSESVYVDGDVTITGNNFIGKGFIYATGKITISGNNTQIGSAAEPVFIYSEKNITISGNNPDMYGIIYAPNGIIDVDKNGWNLYGSLIGESFICVKPNKPAETESCLKNNFTIKADPSYFSGVPIGGWTSGLVE